MVKHIIIWKLKSDLSAEERKVAAETAKAKLESLNGQIPGMTSLSVNILPLDSSTGDMMLDSAFVDNESLCGYQKNPLHLAQAAYVRSVVESRSCFDFEV